MNRTQRRAAMRNEKRRRHMLESNPNMPMQIRHGHNGKQVVMQFSRPTDNLCMTPEQARALIGSVEGAIKMLEQHIAQQQTGADPLAAPGTPPAANDEPVTAGPVSEPSA